MTFVDEIGSCGDRVRAINGVAFCGLIAREQAGTGAVPPIPA